jgi:hypothetical protein
MAPLRVFFPDDLMAELRQSIRRRLPNGGLFLRKRCGIDLLGCVRPPSAWGCFIAFFAGDRNGLVLYRTG